MSVIAIKKNVDATIARYVGHTKNYELKRNGEPWHWAGPVIDLGLVDPMHA